jgi:hypothetical protein
LKTIAAFLYFSIISATGFTREKFPTVTISSGGEYVIIVDGKRYNYEKSISIHHLDKGEHYIDVFEIRKTWLGKKYKLVSSKQFVLDKKDLHIDVNSSGYITIGKQDKGWDGDYWWKNKGKNQ